MEEECNHGQICYTSTCTSMAVSASYPCIRAWFWKNVVCIMMEVDSLTSQIQWTLFFHVLQLLYIGYVLSGVPCDGGPDVGMKGNL